MKSATFCKSILLSVSLLLASSAFAATTYSFQIGNPVNVNGTALKPGDYTVKWDGNGPNVELSILQGSRLKAKVKMCIRDSPNAVSGQTLRVHKKMAYEEGVA